MYSQSIQSKEYSEFNELDKRDDRDINRSGTLSNRTVSHAQQNIDVDTLHDQFSTSLQNLNGNLNSNSSLSLVSQKKMKIEPVNHHLDITISEPSMKGETEDREIQTEKVFYEFQNLNNDIQLEILMKCDIIALRNFCQTSIAFFNLVRNTCKKIVAIEKYASYKYIAKNLHSDECYEFNESIRVQLKSFLDKNNEDYFGKDIETIISLFDAGIVIVCWKAIAFFIDEDIDKEIKLFSKCKSMDDFFDNMKKFVPWLYKQLDESEIIKSFDDNPLQIKIEFLLDAEKDEEKKELLRSLDIILKPEEITDLVEYKNNCIFSDRTLGEQLLLILSLEKLVDSTLEENKDAGVEALLLYISSAIILYLESGRLKLKPNGFFNLKLPRILLNSKRNILLYDIFKDITEFHKKSLTLTKDQQVIYLQLFRIVCMMARDKDITHKFVVFDHLDVKKLEKYGSILVVRSLYSNIKKSFITHSAEIFHKAVNLSPNPSCYYHLGRIQIQKSEFLLKTNTKSVNLLLKIEALLRNAQKNLTKARELAPHVEVVLPFTALYGKIVDLRNELINSLQEYQISGRSSKKI